MADKSTIQVLTKPTSDGILESADRPGWFTLVRQMRKDPTIALVRWLFMAPILAADFSYEVTADAPEGVADFITSQIEPIKFELQRNTLQGCIDFGWQPFEKVFEGIDGVVTLRKCKPLLQDITQIRVLPDGSFNGFENGESSDKVTLEAPESLLVAFDIEGGNLYGQSIMRNVEKTYRRYENANDTSDKYDKKIAGAHWKIVYPVGVTPLNGVDTDNAEIARILLDTMESCGRIAIPVDLNSQLNQMGVQNNGWSVELISPGGQQYAFNDRLKNLEKLFARGFGFPERAILEGQFGTKAEAGEHADFALTMLELRNYQLCSFYNKYLVNDLTRLNYDVVDVCAIVPAPLTDDRKEFFRTLYASILNNPTGFAREIDRLDLDSMRELTGVPSIEVDDVDTALSNASRMIDGLFN